MIIFKSTQKVYSLIITDIETLLIELTREFERNATQSTVYHKYNKFTWLVANRYIDLLHPVFHLSSIMETARFRIKYPIIETCFTNLKAINVEIYISQIYSFTRKPEKKRERRTQGEKNPAVSPNAIRNPSSVIKKGSFKEWKVQPPRIRYKS